MSQTVDASRIPELKEVVSIALEEARRLGATQADADASLQKGLNVTVRLGEVETVEYQRDRGMSVTVYLGHRKGSASTGDFSAAAIRESVGKAAAIARYTAEDECAGLADAADMARAIPQLDLDYPWNIEPDAAVELARQCEAAGRVLDKRLSNSEGASVSTHRGVRVYGNSHGFLDGIASSNHSISCVLLAVDGDDMQRDYWYSTARDPADIENAESIGRQAGQRALRRLGGTKLATRKAPVLFAAELARGLVGHLLGAIRGGAQYRKSTFLLGAAGQQVLPEFFNIHERPHVNKALGSAPYDSEGVATRDRELVRNGVLDGYVMGSYSARKLGLKTTGNAGGNYNLYVDAGVRTLSSQALLREMGTGLLVTEMMGQGVNGVTGDYSRGASGFWVENGVVSYPVHEITIAGNLKEMYRAITAVGDDVDRRGSLQTGSILISEMTIAGE
jgi:PmbA protein